MIDPTRTAGVLGGPAVVGRAVHEGLDLVRAVRGGLPVAALRHMLDTGRLTPGEVDRVVLPRRTLANRRRVGSLTPEQSGRLLRVARVVGLAEETFGAQAKAAAWLRRPTTALADERPLDLPDTDEGARDEDPAWPHRARTRRLMRAGRLRRAPFADRRHAEGTPAVPSPR